MARTGLYPSDVKKARDSLVAAGKRPSLAAIRAALGDTGSLSTISRYLKELELDQAEAVTAQKRSVSESIHDLVDRLTVEMQQEVNAVLEQGRQALEEREKVSLDRIHELETRCADLEQSVVSLSTDLAAERSAHKSTLEALTEVSMHRARLEQQATELFARIRDHEEHKKSLEDKHNQARLTLEHFRQAAKEQRDQEHQRHGEQLHQLQTELHHLRQTLAGKAEEISRLSGEGTRLLTELSILRKDFDASSQRAERAEKSLQKADRENEALITQLGILKTTVQTQTTDLGTAKAQTDALQAMVNASQIREAVQEAQILGLRDMVARQQELLNRGLGEIAKPVA